MRCISCESLVRLKPAVDGSRAPIRLFNPPIYPSTNLPIQSTHPPICQWSLQQSCYASLPAILGPRVNPVLRLAIVALLLFL